MTASDCKNFLKRNMWPGTGLLLGAALISYQADSFRRVWQSLFAPVVYFKDCISPFLMAKALRHGVNPYLPLPELTARWLSAAHPVNHPTPYPPFVAFVSLPLAFVSYETVTRIWLGLEIACVLGTILLLLRWWGTSLHPLKVAVILGLSIVWMPLNEELWQGQFMSCLMLLLVGAWLSLRAGKQVLGGALVGALIAIKMTGSPIFLFLALRRKWRAVFSAAAVIIIANLLAMAALGPTVVIDYYHKVAPDNAKLWRPAEANMSAWAWGIRLFQGAGFSYHLHPLYDAPKLAEITTYLFPLAILLLGLTMAWRARNFDTTFSWLAFVSILFGPIAWYFYLLLAVIPIVVLARRLTVQRFPLGASGLGLTFWVLMSVKPSFYDHLAKSGSSGMYNAAYHMVGVPFAAGLFTLIPTAALFGLLWLVYWTDERKCWPSRVSEEQLAAGDGKV